VRAASFRHHCSLRVYPGYIQSVSRLYRCKGGWYGQEMKTGWVERPVRTGVLFHPGRATDIIHPAEERFRGPYPVPQEPGCYPVRTGVLSHYAKYTSGTMSRKNRDAIPLRKVRFGDYVPQEPGCYPTTQSTLRGLCPQVQRDPGKPETACPGVLLSRRVMQFPGLAKQRAVRNEDLGFFGQPLWIEQLAALQHHQPAPRSGTHSFRAAGHV